MSTVPTPVYPPLAQTLAPGPRRAGRGAGVLVALCTALPLLSLLAVALMAGHYESIFRDFGLALPGLTRGYLALGRGLMTPLGAAVALLLTAGVAGLAALALGRSWRAAAVWAVLMTLLTIVLFGGFMAAMYVPLTSMVGALQGGKV